VVGLARPARRRSPRPRRPSKRDACGGPLSIGECDNQTARNEIGSRAGARKSERPQSTVSDSRRKSRKRRVISNVVREELERAPANLRQSILEGIRGLELELFVEDLESRRLFAVYEQARIVPARYRNDLRHVAVATVARADALVSWNFKHLVNLKTRRMVHATNLRLGYPLIDIVSPEEV
jgi:predicted nucleic acid-binding protein